MQDRYQNFVSINLVTPTTHAEWATERNGERNNEGKNRLNEQEEHSRTPTWITSKSSVALSATSRHRPEPAMSYDGIGITKKITASNRPKISPNTSVRGIGDWCVNNIWR